MRLSEIGLNIFIGAVILVFVALVIYMVAMLYFTVALLSAKPLLVTLAILALCFAIGWVTSYWWKNVDE